MKQKQPSINLVNSCGNSNFGKTHNLTGQGPEQPVPTGINLSRSLD